MQRSTSSTTDLRAQATHLVVFQHGLWGNEKDFRNFQTLFQQYFPQDEIYTHIATSNATSLSSIFQTYDGVDVGGVRLADEVMEVAKEMPRLAKFSIAGHSLGGLYARYCIGVLFSRGFFEDIEPMNFITLATPHMGIRRTQKSAPWNAVFNAIMPSVFDLTGQQFTLTDVASEETLALSKSVRKYPHRKRFTVYTEMEGVLSVRVASASASAAEKSGVEATAFEPMECKLDSDGFLRVYPLPAQTSEVSVAEKDTSAPPQENDEAAMSEARSAGTTDEATKQADDIDGPANIQTSEELPVESASEESAPPTDTEPKETPAVAMAEVDVVEAKVTVLLPEHDPKTRRRSHSRRKSLSTSFLHSESLHWDIEIEEASPANDGAARPPKTITIRIPYMELVTQWRWVAALSNASHGVLCQPQTTPEKPARAIAPTLLSCLTRGQFLQALQLFRARALYASIFNDLQVPYSCGSIRAYNPYRGEPEPVDHSRSPYYPHVIMRSLWNAPLLRDTLPEDVAARVENGSTSRNSFVKSLGERQHSKSRRHSHASRHHHSFGMSFSKFLSSSSSDVRFSRSSSEVPPPTFASSSSVSSSSSSMSSSFIHRRLDAIPQAPSNGAIASVAEGDEAKASETSEPPFFSQKEFKRLPPFEDGSLLLDHADQAFSHDGLRDDLRGMLLSLQSVGWRRIDVSFHSPLAHMKIVAMTANPAKPLTKGLDVVHHVMDTFLL